MVGEFESEQSTLSQSVTNKKKESLESFVCLG